MAVPVMGVGQVRMIVHELGVMMLVAVRLPSRVRRPMSMSMMLVMDMEVRVRHLLVAMRV